MAYFIFNDSILKNDGKSYVTGYWSQAYIIETCVLITVLIKALMVTEWITIITFAGIAVMLFFHILIMLIVNYFYYYDEGSIFLVFQAPSVILIVMFILITNILPEVAIL